MLSLDWVFRLPRQAAARWLKQLGASAVGRRRLGCQTQHHDGGYGHRMHFVQLNETSSKAGSALLRLSRAGKWAVTAETLLRRTQLEFPSQSDASRV